MNRGLKRISIILFNKPVNALEEELKEVCDDVKVIGGAVKTNNAGVAAKEGFFAGMNI